MITGPAAPGPTGPLAGVRQRVPGGGSAVWVLASTGVNAAATYLLLIVVGRALGLVRFADFSVFWAVTIISGLGFFLPLEQETARRVAAGGSGGGRAVWLRGLRLGVVIALVAAAVAAAVWWRGENGPVIVLAFLIAAAGYAIQFPARGVLSGQRRLARYGSVAAIDAVVRLAGVLVLAVVGVRSTAAYDLVIAGSAMTAGVVAVALAGLRRRVGPPRTSIPAVPAVSVEQAGPAVGSGFARDALRLVLAAACMQLLLNSGTLVARGFAGPGQLALAGQLLVMMTLVRLPVFVFQSLQATYLTRLAGGVHRGDRSAVRRLLLLLTGAVGGIAALVVAGAAALGPWAVRTLFGHEYAVTRPTAVLVAVSVAAYLIASVANDASVAVGAHRRIVLAWPIGVLAAAGAVAVLGDLIVRSTLPLALGAVVAAVVLLPGIVRHFRTPGGDPAVNRIVVPLGRDRP